MNDDESPQRFDLFFCRKPRHPGKHQDESTTYLADIDVNPAQSTIFNNSIVDAVTYMHCPNIATTDHVVHFVRGSSVWVRPVSPIVQIHPKVGSRDELNHRKTCPVHATQPLIDFTVSRYS